ncbi:MAG: hypothetical protein VW882_06195 [Gammaproteobacteria bacterium]|jgi:hypothetical protein
MDVLIPFAGFILLLYLITRKWFWMTVLALFVMSLLFTPLASIAAVALVVVAGFIVLHLLFIAMVFVLSTLFMFS